MSDDEVLNEPPEEEGDDQMAGIELADEVKEVTEDDLKDVKADEPDA